MTKEEMRKFLTEQDWTKNLGTVPPAVPFLKSERQLLSVHMAAIAAIVQLAKEGVISEVQIMHFAGHLQDFAARLYAGETVDLNAGNLLGVQSSDGAPQTFKADSVMGQVFLYGALSSLEDGRIEREETAAQSDNISSNLGNRTLN